MARQEVDIGIEGNDGTGDSIRESFRKVNENFKEIYAVVGKGGQITFTLLADTPDDLAPFAGDGNAAYIPMVTQDGTAIEIRRIGSNVLDESDSGLDTVEVKVSQDGALILKTKNIQLQQDPKPVLGGPLNAATLAIANISTTQASVEAVNAVHGTSITIDDLVIDKKFADQNYIPRQLPGEVIAVPDEPADAGAYLKTFTVLNTRASMPNHGFTKGSTGKSYKLRTTGAGLDWTYVVRNPLTNEAINITSATAGQSPLENGDTVYITVRDTNTLEFFINEEYALEENSVLREELRLKLTTKDSATLQLEDADYDTSLEGFFLSNQVMPRKSVVRRQGDVMEGALILHDHPGDLAGAGTPNGITDKQAVTKLYVDSQSTESSTNIYVSTVGDDAQLIAPPGKEGSSLAYAFRTVGAAARKAEQINISSPYEPGPYMQDIIYSRVVQEGQPPVVTRTQVTSAAVITDAGLGSRANAKAIIDANIEFIVAETLEWVRQRIAAGDSTTVGTETGSVIVNWTDRVINERLTELEIIRSLNAATLDHVAGLTATTLSTRIGLEFYNDEYGKAQAGLTKDVFVSILDRVKTVAANVITNDSNTPFAALQSIYAQSFATFVDPTDSQDIGSISGENGNLQLQIDIINAGVFSIRDNINIKGLANVAGNRYRLRFSNGQNDFVDQGNPQNNDLRTGKVIRGKTSGALGRIVTYTQGGSQDDTIELELLTPIEFSQGENLEFGNLVNNRQITIRIETGQYEEDYPIRVPAQTSLVGDEMRRVIIRPKKRTSQSPWAGIYFYRDLEFDGLRGDNQSITGIPDPNLPSTGTPYVNPLSGVVDGYFGRHYLVDPTARKNVDDNGLLVYSNTGQYISAAVLVEKNKSFIVEEVIAFIDERVARPSPPAGYIITWTNAERDRYRRKLGIVLDLMSKDLREGGRLGVLEAQGELFFDSQEFPNEETVAEQSLTYINLILNDVLANQAFIRQAAVTPFIGAGHPTQYINTNLVTDPILFGNDGLKSNQIELLKFAFDIDYNPAKRSTDMDVFLMNDATIIRNMSITGHGGFMTVLDPEGQILTKSPYIQTGSSFSQSLNRQAFRGGMLVDAFCANTPLTVTNVVDSLTIQVKGDPGSGLAERKPQTPAPFYINGIRYQVNDIIQYQDGGESGEPTATLILDASSGPANPVIDGATLGWNIPIPVGGYDITLQTAGNRSQLGNDFTQVNDLGYGLVTINGGLSEMVSMFTYYCWTAYYAGNGGQIRSTNGSNCNGVYGLVAEGSDPNEVPDAVVLDNDMTQSAFTFSAQIVLELDDVLSLTAGDTITNAATGATGTATSVFSSNGKKIYLQGVTGSFSQGNTIFVNGVSSSRTVSILDTTGYTNLQTQLSMYVYETEFVPANKGEIDFYHSSLSTSARYELANVEIADGIIVDGYTIDPTEYTQNFQTRGTNIDGIFGNNESRPDLEDTEATIVVQKVSRNGGQYKVNIFRDEVGNHYKIGDTFTISGTQLGGATPANDAVVTVTEINRSAINIQNNIQTGSIRRLSITGTPNIIAGFTPQRDGQVYKLNFSTSNDEFDNDGLLTDIPLGQTVTIRNNQTHLFREVENINDLTIRPSTAVNFQDDPEDTYRSISFGRNDSAGNPLFDDQTLTGFDATYDFLRLIVSPNNVSRPGTDISPAVSSTTLGSTQGDTTIAIDIIPEVREQWRLNNNLITELAYKPPFTDEAGKVYAYTAELPKVIDWRGKKHYVYNYREVEFNAGTNKYDETQVWGEQNSFALVDLKEISEVRLTLNVAGTWDRLRNYLATPTNAIVRQVGNTGAFGYVKIDGELSTQLSLYEWSGVNFNLSGALEISYDAGNSYTTLVNPTDGSTQLVPLSQDIRDTNLTAVTGDGLAESVAPTSTQAVLLRAGLQDGAPATITIDISTCRATGHDFLDIGTGSFNQTNYPNVLLGLPATEANQGNEVQERNKGRVFYVSTDQDGFFRVGRFFTVDQGTGTVTFAASIALSDVDGIGFKRGVVVTEFSTDTSMSDNAIDSVPTESAVRGYVNRRLGYDQAGNAVTNPIGPSVLTQNGAVPLTGDLSAGGNTITNLAPVDLELTGARDAVPREYVDSRAEAFNKVNDLRDVEIDDASAHEFMGFTGAKIIYITVDNNLTGNFILDRALINSNGTKVYGYVTGFRDYYDPNFGDVKVVSFTPGPDVDEFTEVTAYSFANGGIGSVTGVTIYEGVPTFDGNGVVQTPITPGGQGEVINGPYPEVINISEEPFVNSAPVSDIGFTTRRVQTTDTPNDGFPDSPTAYVNFQINDEVIVNQDVAPAAGILQSKLAMQEADVFVTDVNDIEIIDAVEMVQGVTYQIVSPTNGSVNWTTYGAANNNAGTVFTANTDGITAGLASAGATIKRNLTAINIQNLADDTYPNNQAELGLVKMDGAHFKVTRGHTQLKNNGITLDKIEKLAADTVIGNSQNVEANCAEITFNTVVDEGGGILHTDMSYTNTDGTNAAFLATGVGANNTNAGVITRTGSETYAVLPTTTTGVKNSFVKTSNSGNITADTISIGQNADQIVLDTFGTGDNGLKLTTPQGGVVLTAQYDTNSTNPLINTPASINVGGMVDPAQGSTSFTQSTLQGGSLNNQSWVSADWMYTAFIEAPGEKGNATTGISIGAGSGKTSTGEVAIVVANTSNSTSPVVAKFSVSGMVPDSNAVYNIGTSDLRYGDSYFKSVTVTNGVAAGGAVSAGTTLSAGSSLSVGTSASVGTTLTVTGDTTLTGITTFKSYLAADSAVDIGTSLKPFKDIYGSTFSGTAATAKFADLAENYLADAAYEPGTVVVFGGDAEVTVCTSKGDHRVAGVVSTDPAYLMNSHQEGEYVAAIALQGRVPCKVIGKVRKGDMLVTSAIPGYAIVNNTPTIGTVIGKALEDKDDDAKGIIEVVVGRV